MAFLVRYPLSASVVLAALAATAAVFLLARPHYHPKGEDSLVKLDLSKYPPASRGWAWENGQPGFRFGEDEKVWNLSKVKPVELIAVRAAARRSGIAPASIRVINSIRLGPRDLSLVVAGTNAADDTCLGFVTPSKTDFYCPPRLGPQSAFVLVITRPAFEGDPTHAQPTFLTGITRADVRRVVVDQPQDWLNAGVYDRELGSPWGIFELSLSNGRGIDITLVHADGASQTVHVDETTPGDRLLPIG
jgi:hypothetical protein